MKIYTKAGDTGETALFGGGSARKDAARVEAYGSLDELNACLGVAIASLDARTAELADVLRALQAELFEVGWELATPIDKVKERLAARVPITSARQVEALEAIIDRHEEALTPLRTFILPGGAPAAAALHAARTVARRTERRVVSLATQEPLNPEILRYLNRLSDLLFVLARTANRLEGQEDIPWHPRGAETATER